MPKPPESLPSSDIGGVRQDRYRQDDPAPHEHPGDAEELARRESHGRPGNTKR